LVDTTIPTRSGGQFPRMFFEDRPPDPMQYRGISERNAGGNSITSGTQSAAHPVGYCRDHIYF